MHRGRCFVLLMAVCWLSAGICGAQEEESVRSRGGTIESGRTFGPMSATRGGPEQPDFEGETIVVRIYDKWRDDPSAYSMELAEVRDGCFKLDRQTISANAFVAVSGDDQTYAGLRKLLENRIHFLTAGQRSTDKPARGRYCISDFRNVASRLPASLVIRDAMGKPIEGATVQVTLREGQSGEGVQVRLKGRKTATAGQVTLPAVSGPMQSIAFRVEHADYGITEQPHRIWDKGNLHLPLVAANSEAAARALRGVVVTPEGTPVADAVVKCRNVRSMGEGLITPRGGDPSVLTDKSGRFRLYPRYEDPDEEVGDLIPPHARYLISVSAPDRDDLFAHTEEPYNDKPVRVSMVRGVADHTFRFEDGTGKPVDPYVLEQFRIGMDLSDGKAIKLPRDLVANGGKIPLGTLKPSTADNAGWKFPTVEVTAKSPADLVFRSEPRRVYTGRVVNGVTGEGLAGAIVFAHNHSSNEGLADLTAEQWKAMHALPANPPPDEPALKPLKRMYGLTYAARTGPDGTFRLAPPPEMKYYSWMAIEQNFMGYQRRTNDLKPNKEGTIAVPDLPLFPAVTMRVKLLLENEKQVRHASFWPEWIIETGDRPAWAKKLVKHGRAQWGWCEYTEWVKANREELFLMPAGLRYRLKINAPYSDELCDVKIDREFEPRQGEIIDLGEHKVEFGWGVLVRVLGPSGEPLEGIPVRRGARRPGGGFSSFSVAHNTDAGGIAQFYVEPGSKGAFAVRDYADSEDRKTLNTEVSFEIAAEPADVQMFTIRLNEKAVQALVKPKGE